jgi:hypothetical protein
MQVTKLSLTPMTCPVFRIIFGQPLTFFMVGIMFKPHANILVYSKGIMELGTGSHLKFQPTV